jgi:hypothetical protein
VDLEVEQLWPMLLSFAALFRCSACRQPVKLQILLRLSLCLPDESTGPLPPFPSAPIEICCSSDRVPQPLPQTGASRSKAEIAACREENHFDGIEETLRSHSRCEWKGPEMKKSMLPSIAFLAAALAVGSVGIATDALARGGEGSHGGSGGHSSGASSQSHSVGSASTSQSTDQTDRFQNGHDDWDGSYPGANMPVNRY